MNQSGVVQSCKCTMHQSFLFSVSILKAHGIHTPGALIKTGKRKRQNNMVYNVLYLQLRQAKTAQEANLYVLVFRSLAVGLADKGYK